MVDPPTRHNRTAAPPPATGAAAPDGDVVDLPASYRAAVERLLASYRALPPGATVRLAKRTSNLFRSRQAGDAPGLDVSGLQGVLALDPTARTADVGGMCKYQDLVAHTLKYGLVPLVVPQLKTITVGGAATGLGIESSSFRSGLPHDGIVEMDVLTGGGDILTVSPNRHRELYYGFPNSYGTLGYATRLRIRLEPVPAFVSLRHLSFTAIEELQVVMARIVDTGRHDGVPVHYLDGVVFRAGESYLTLGTMTDDPGPVSNYTGQRTYYRSIQQRRTDRLTIADYLWRWDTDWFWCSRAFGAQQPIIRRLWPKRLRRSSFYWKLVALDRRLSIADRWERLRGRPPLERVVQDVEVPIELTAEFVGWFLDTVPIAPLWLCPLRLPSDPTDDRELTWPLYPIGTEKTYVNVGFWSTVPQQPDQPEGGTNRLIERKVKELRGHKSLYSDSYYSEEEFAALYGGDAYAELKAAYDPHSRLLNLYDKAVRRK